MQITVLSEVLALMCQRHRQRSSTDKQGAYGVERIFNRTYSPTCLFLTSSHLNASSLHMTNCVTSVYFVQFTIVGTLLSVKIVHSAATVVKRGSPQFALHHHAPSRHDCFRFDHFLNTVMVSPHSPEIQNIMGRHH